jgi:hypothetical protein
VTDARELLDVAARAERASTAAVEDRAANAGVGGDLAQRAVERVQQIPRHEIQRSAVKADLRRSRR